MRPYVRLAALVFVLGFATAAGAQEISVTDGDTIRIGDERIRLLGIDTPEKGHLAACLAERMLARLATQRLRDLVTSGEPIVLERDSVDRFGRTLAVVRVGDRDAAEVLIDEGYGRPWRGRQEDWCGE